MFIYLISKYPDSFWKYRFFLSKVIFIRVLGIFILTVTMMIMSQAQQAQPEPILGFSGEPLSCDDGVAFHDLVVTEATEKMKEDSVLFVLVSQGTEENSNELLRRRIYNIRQYFRDRGNRLSSEKIIIAIGQRVSGNSRLEYYINGQLYLRLLYPKNGYICHSCCGPNKEYYPDKEIYETNKNKSKKRKVRN